MGLNLWSDLGIGNYALFLVLYLYSYSFQEMSFMSAQNVLRVILILYLWYLRA